MIYVNGRFLTQFTTGVQRFAEEISLQLKLIRDDVIFLVPDLSIIKKEALISSIKIVEIKGFKGHLWEQITLPLYLMKIKKPLLVNLCNTAPAFYCNQISTHHDITYLKYPKSFPMSFRLLYRTLSPLMIKNSKHLITVSEFSKEEISNHYKCPLDKITVIQNAVSDNFNNLSNRNDFLKEDGYFLAVSSTNYHKNFHGLIDAFLKAKVKAKLKIIGGHADVFSKLDLNNSSPRIEFLGRVNDCELVELYKNAKAFVFPSFYEGFGIPPLEAQACGCPVISSDKASMPEVLIDSVLYFNPDSIFEMTTSLEKVDIDSTLRGELISKGLDNVKRFSWAKSAVRLNDVINRF